MGVLLLCKVEQERRPKSSKGKALRGRHDGIMDSSKFGVMNCFVKMFKSSGVSTPLHFSITA